MLPRKDLINISNMYNALFPGTIYKFYFMIFVQSIYGKPITLHNSQTKGNNKNYEKYFTRNQSGVKVYDVELR